MKRGSGRGGGAHVCGLHAVAGVLRRSPGAVRGLWLQAGARNPRIAELERLARTAGVEVFQRPADELDRLAGGARHQGAAAEVDLEGITLGEHELDAIVRRAESPPLFLILDGIQDPHNLGACLRTADAAAVDAVVAPRDRAAGLTPVVCKVASGAVGHVPFVRVTNLARALRRLRDAGVWIAGLDAEGTQAIDRADLRVPLALVLGAEGTGLRRLTRDHCDLLLAIPMHGAVESLNVSVAAGVCLYEARRQRAAAG